MSQKSRAKFDIVVVGWNDIPVSNRINEATPNDTRFVTSDVGGGNLTVSFDNLVLPIDGAYRLTVRLKHTESGQPVNMYLMQEGVIIAGKHVTPGASFSDEVLELSPTQRAKITDYSKLSLRVAVEERWYLGIS